MTLQRVARWLAFGLAAGAAWIGFSSPAQAIPVFARQTGHNCQACHISFPELTAYGREFKLNGYTFGEAQPVPLAVALMAEYDTVKDNTRYGANGPGTTGVNCTGCFHSTMVQWSFFYGGRITDNFGMFGQGTSGEFPIGSGGGPSGGGTFTPTADNTDIRYVHRFSTDSSLEPDTVVGLDLNNNFMVEDVWMTGPAWRYPNGGGGIAYSFNAGSPNATYGLGPVTALFIDNLGTTPGNGGPQKQVGIGVYAWWHKTIYAEISAYRAPWGFFSWMAWGQGNTEQSQDASFSASAPAASTLLANYNPYARLVYQRDWGYNSLSVGLFGLDAKTYDCSPFDQGCNTSTNKFHDVAVDAQYQYNKGEPWVFTAQTSFEHESNDLSASYNNPTYGNYLGLSAPTHTLKEFNINGRAYYERMYGVNVGYSMITGSADNGLYGANGSGAGLSNIGSPDSSFWTIELNYLPVQNMRFTLQYTAYTKLNGGTSNFDGLGNSASGQNHLTGAIWWVF